MTGGNFVAGRAAGAQDGRRVGCPAERVADADWPHETRRRRDARIGGRRVSSPFASRGHASKEGTR